MGSEFAGKSNQATRRKNAQRRKKSVRPTAPTHVLQRTLGNKAISSLLQSGQVGTGPASMLQLVGSKIPNPIVLHRKGLVSATVYFGRNSFFFNSSGDQSHGLMAERSGRHQKGQIDLHFFQ